MEGQSFPDWIPFPAVWPTVGALDRLADSAGPRSPRTPPPPAPASEQSSREPAQQGPEHGPDERAPKSEFPADS